jgi:3-oxoacyl-[acyl-carrier-protein] synthase-3
LNIFLNSMAIELGEQRCTLDSLSDVKAQFSAIRLPFNKALLGCEHFHQSDKSPIQMLGGAIKEAVENASLQAGEIDQLIIASANLQPLLGDSQQVAQLLVQNGLVNAIPMAITGQECTGLLSAIEMARMIIMQGQRRRVLVVSFDKLDDGASRVKPFGVFSDAAFACVISDEVGQLEILNANNRFNFDAMQQTDNAANRKAFAIEATQDVLATAKIQLSDIAKVFSTNFYQPIASFNAAALGLSKTQLSTQTSKEHGHCVCGDPILNLSDHLSRCDSKTGEHYLLQSYAPGFLASVLLRAV